VVAGARHPDVEQACALVVFTRGGDAAGIGRGDGVGERDAGPAERPRPVADAAPRQRIAGVELRPVGLGVRAERGAALPPAEGSQDDHRPLETLRLVIGADGDGVLARHEVLVVARVAAFAREDGRPRLVEEAQEPGDRRGFATLAGAILVRPGERAERVEVAAALCRLRPGGGEAKRVERLDDEVEGLGGRQLGEPFAQRCELRLPRRDGLGLALGDTAEPRLEPGLLAQAPKAVERFEDGHRQRVLSVEQPAQRRIDGRAFGRREQARARVDRADAACLQRRREEVGAGVRVDEDRDVAAAEVARDASRAVDDRCRGRVLEEPADSFGDGLSLLVVLGGFERPDPQWRKRGQLRCARAVRRDRDLVLVVPEALQRRREEV
jgi:hypothetical protein